MTTILCGTMKHSPQRRERGATHRGGKYAVKVIVGEACVYQSNRLVFFVIRRGDPPVRTCIPGIRIPAKLGGRKAERRDAIRTTATQVPKVSPTPAVYLAVALLLLRHLCYLVVVQILQIL